MFVCVCAHNLYCKHELPQECCIYILLISDRLNPNFPKIQFVDSPWKKFGIAYVELVKRCHERILLKREQNVLQ